MMTGRYGVDPVFTSTSERLYRPTMDGKEGDFYNVSAGENFVIISVLGLAETPALQAIAAGDPLPLLLSMASYASDHPS
jgi:hypothetical protein